MSTNGETIDRPTWSAAARTSERPAPGWWRLRRRPGPSCVPGAVAGSDGDPAPRPADEEPAGVWMLSAVMSAALLFLAGAAVLQHLDAPGDHDDDEGQHGRDRGAVSHPRGVEEVQERVVRGHERGTLGPRSEEHTS